MSFLFLHVEKYLICTNKTRNGTNKKIEEHKINSKQHKEKCTCTGDRLWQQLKGKCSSTVISNEGVVFEVWAHLGGTKVVLKLGRPKVKTEIEENNNNNKAKCVCLEWKRLWV